MCVSAAVSRASHFVSGVPSRFCQPGLVEHAGDVLERVVSGGRADGGRGEQQQTSMSHVTGHLRRRQLFG